MQYQNGEKIALNFWDEQGIQTLKDGFGFTYEVFGANDHDIFKHFYENGIFKFEERVSGATFKGFNPEVKGE